MRYEIRSDGRVVWVNGENGCVARFGPYLAEIVRSKNPVIQPDKEPYYMTKTTGTAFTEYDWREFGCLLFIAHGVWIPVEFDRTKEQVIEVTDD